MEAVGVFCRAQIRLLGATAPDRRLGDKGMPPYRSAMGVRDPRQGFSPGKGGSFAFVVQLRLAPILDVVRQ